MLGSRNIGGRVSRDPGLQSPGRINLSYTFIFQTNNVNIDSTDLIDDFHLVAK